MGVGGEEACKEKTGEAVPPSHKGLQKIGLKTDHLGAHDLDSVMTHASGWV